jgi:CheY-like chemotaxis protein
MLQRAVHKDNASRMGQDLTAISDAASKIQILCQQLRLAAACRHGPASDASTPRAELQTCYDHLRHHILGQHPEYQERLPLKAPRLCLGISATLFEGLLRELLMNSLEFTEGPLEIHSQKADSLGCILLTDQGPPKGASVPETWATPLEGSAGRLGLGASLVSNLAKALEGNLELKETSSGNQWCLSLPLCAEEASPQEPPSPPIGPRTVLCIDDQIANRHLVQRALEAQGWKVLLAESGETGLATLQDAEADVVLLDLHLPGMDGYEVARLIRRQGYRGPLLAFSASSCEKNDSTEAGPFDAFLDKNGQINDLHPALTLHLKGWMSRRAKLFKDFLGFEQAFEALYASQNPNERLGEARKLLETLSKLEELLGSTPSY